MPPPGLQAAGSCCSYIRVHVFLFMHLYARRHEHLLQVPGQSSAFCINGCQFITPFLLRKVSCGRLRSSGHSPGSPGVENLCHMTKGNLLLVKKKDSTQLITVTDSAAYATSVCTKVTVASEKRRKHSLQAAAVSNTRGTWRWDRNCHDT